MFFRQAVVGRSLLSSVLFLCAQSPPSLWPISPSVSHSLGSAYTHPSVSHAYDSRDPSHKFICYNITLMSFFFFFFIISTCQRINADGHTLAFTPSICSAPNKVLDTPSPAQEPPSGNGVGFWASMFLSPPWCRCRLCKRSFHLAATT